MELSDFEILSEKEQVDLLRRNGIYVGKHKTGNSIFLMFQLERFYVEIEYKKYREYIKTIKCFESTNYLDPYLTEIKIELIYE